MKVEHSSVNQGSQKFLIHSIGSLTVFPTLLLHRQFYSMMSVPIIVMKPCLSVHMLIFDSQRRYQNKSDCFFQFQTAENIIHYVVQHT